MKKRNLIITTIACVMIMLLSACKEQSTPSMPEGKGGIEIQGIMQINFRHTGESALEMKYYTFLDIDDKVELEKEAIAIWEQIFKPEVEKTDLQLAYLSPQEKPSGFISKTKGYRFLYKKDADGKWEMQNKPSAKQVDPIVQTPVDKVEAQSTQGHP
jgi:hypothetical protein